MSQYDMMKLFSAMEGEADVGDFTPEELSELLSALSQEDAPVTPEEWKRRYFAFYDDIKDKSLKRQDW